MDSSLTSVPHSALFILLAALQLNSAAEVCCYGGACCVPEKHVRVDENNRVDFIVSTINITENPVQISNQANVTDVAVVGDTLRLTKSIDYEKLESRVMLVMLQCGIAKDLLMITIEIVNVNDNPVKFPQGVLNLNISEFFPVNEIWKTETANDPDCNQIFYTLDPNTDGAEYFHLKSSSTPNITLSKAIDYEKTKSLQLILYATDNQTDPSRTVNLTINISVLDEDNRPPVFEPCPPVPGSTANICFNAAYTGNITQNKIETGPLQLDPQQIQAVDGDKGINATIRYRIIAGDHENAFIMNPTTGAITMTNVVTSPNPVVLTVMAYQENDHYKFSTTTVSLKVLRVNQCLPKFTSNIYNGNIQEHSEPKSIVIGQGTITKPLVIQAEDCDFPDKINPSIKYEITPNDIFTINRDGFIFTKTEIPAGISMYELMVTATDGENGDTAAAKVNVQVISSNAPTTVKTTTTHGSGTPKPPTKPPGTGPTISGVSTPSKAPGPSGSTTATSPRPGSGHTTAPTTVKTTTTTHGTGTPKPPPKPPGTGPTTTGASTPSKAPPGPPGSTTAKPPGTGPTATKPHVTGSTSTNDPGPPGSIPPSGNPPDGPGTGPTTTPTTVKTTTTTHGTGTPKPPPKPPGTGPTTTGASTPSKAPPGPPGSTTAKPPGTGPTATKPHVTGSTSTNDPGPPGSIPPSGNPPDGSGTGPTTTPTTVKTTTTTHGTGTPKPPPKPPGTGPTTTGASTPSKAPPGPPGSDTAKPPGTGPTATKPHITGSITTNDPGPPGSIHPSGNPSDGPGTGPTTSLPAVNPRLIYEAKHMAALGVPLGILLIICLVIIGILLHKMHRWIMEWEQITDGSVTKLKALSRGLFSPENDKLQFSNEGYQEEETSENAQKSSWPALNNPVVESVALAAVLDPTVENSDLTGSSGNHTDPVSQRSKAAATSQEDHKASGSLGAPDTDTEVKSILTKERKSDEGYKSVWFKEDIEPEANEERVIERHDGEENDDDDRDMFVVQLGSDDGCSISL
ncbi:cadherin-related family member 5-like [Scyliorhinus canicula]|uniref:cadherin-related family member 5-like n=1 Tax=Scyliorhinus canicula TaxID=7830 RepID=UPI0018F572B6|nr:cadherin-related family member 5-like [Scyliorhinus canicula]